MLESKNERRKAWPSFFFLSFLFFIGIFNSVSPIFGGYDGVRWALLIILPISLLVFLYFDRTTPTTLTLLIIVASGAGSFFLAMSPPLIYLIFEAEYWVVIFLFGRLIAREKNAVSIAETTKNLAVVGLIFASLYVLTIMMGLVFWYEQGSGKVTDFLPFGFYNIRMWSHIATWIIPVVCGGLFYVSTVLQQRRMAFCIWGILVLGLWFMVLLGSGARGSLLAQIVALIFMSALYRRNFWNIGKFWIYGLISGAILYLIFVKIIPQIMFEQAGHYQVFRTGASGRGQLWEYALSLSLENLPFGAGSLAYSYRTPVDAYATPHSLYLTWASEYGWLFVILAAVAFIKFSLPVWSRASNPSSRADSRLRFGIQFSVLSALIHALVSGVFANPISQIVGFPILTVYFALCFKGREGLNGAIMESRSIGYFALACLGLSILILTPAYDWWQASIQDAFAYMKENHIGLAPRFWIHGRFIGNEGVE